MSQSIEQQPIAYVERPRTPLADPSIDSEIALVMQRLHSHGWTVGGDGPGRAPSAAEAATVAYIATQYGLDPLLGEVLLLGNKVYIPHSALERRAREQKLIVRRKCRPASAEERAVARVDDAEEYWVAEVETTDGIVYEGHGMASPDNVAIARRGGNVDRRIVRNMAEKRALQRALRYAVGVSLPDPEEAPVVVGMVAPPTIADKGAALAQAAAALAPPRPAPHEVYPQFDPATHVEPAPARKESRPTVAAQSDWRQTIPDEDIQRLNKRIQLLMRRGVAETALYDLFVQHGSHPDAWVASLPIGRLADVYAAISDMMAKVGAA